MTWHHHFFLLIFSSSFAYFAILQDHFDHSTNTPRSSSSSSRYHTGMVPANGIPNGTLMVLWYHMVPWYTCTNITLSQKRLEIQALRCNGNTSGRTMVAREHQWHQLVRLRVRVRTLVPHVYHGTRVRTRVYHTTGRPFDTTAQRLFLTIR